MAAELKRKDDDTILIAIHPGEVATYVDLWSDADKSFANEPHQGYGKH